ncbi:MAG: hypothetical protein KGH71_05040 [Candidatus Micrarchaeota archaeon]|nr:hypothetical protein [Candidatus Micrarchaeota archaeon]
MEAIEKMKTGLVELDLATIKQLQRGFFITLDINEIKRDYSNASVRAEASRILNALIDSPKPEYGLSTSGDKKYFWAGIRLLEAKGYISEFLVPTKDTEEYHWTIMKFETYYDLTENGVRELKKLGLLKEERRGGPQTVIEDRKKYTSFWG